MKGRFKLQEQRLKQTATTAQNRVKELEAQVLSLEKENVGMRHEIDTLQDRERRRPATIVQNTPHSNSAQTTHVSPAPSQSRQSSQSRSRPSQGASQGASQGGALSAAQQRPPTVMESVSSHSEPLFDTASYAPYGDAPSVGRRPGLGAEDISGEEESDMFQNQQEVLEFDNGARQEDRMLTEAMYDVAVGYDPNRYNDATPPHREAGREAGNASSYSTRGQSLALPPNEPSMLAVPPPPTRREPPHNRNHVTDVSGGGSAVSSNPTGSNPTRSTGSIGVREGEEGSAGGDKVERRFSDGRVVTWYSNGTHKEVGVDGQVVVRFANGDIKRTSGQDNIVTYYYESAKTTHTTFPNGDELFEFPSGQTERHNLDGTKEIHFSDGNTFHI